MKKTFLLTGLLILGFNFGFGLILGPAIIVDCDKCGATKKLISVVSGNTFGATRWSDLYLETLMLPSISSVQKCDSCQAIFLVSEQNMYRSEDPEDISTDTGRLTWDEIKNAISLLNESTLSDDKQYSVRLEILQRFNDAYRYNDTPNESDQEAERTQEDWELHRQNVEGIVALLDIQNPMFFPLIAEFYREGAFFEETLSLLNGFQPADDMVKFVETVKTKAQEKDFKVFILEEE